MRPSGQTVEKREDYIDGKEECVREAQEGVSCTIQIKSFQNNFKVLKTCAGGQNDSFDRLAGGPLRPSGQTVEKREDYIDGKEECVREAQEGVSCTIQIKSFQNNFKVLKTCAGGQNDSFDRLAGGPLRPSGFLLFGTVFRKALQWKATVCFETGKTLLRGIPSAGAVLLKSIGTSAKNCLTQRLDSPLRKYAL